MSWPAEIFKHSDGMVSAPAQPVRLDSVESLLKGTPLYESFVESVGSRETANRQIAGVTAPDPHVGANETHGE